MSRKGPRIPMTHYKDKRLPCPEMCNFRYSGIEKDSRGQILRSFSCESHCRRR